MCTVGRKIIIVVTIMDHVGQSIDQVGESTAIFLLVMITVRTSTKL